MRIVSMVPSWTETLVRSGAEVVGRTRFCIHPQELVADIPVVGGTKDVHWHKVEGLQPDLIVLDREENPASMAQESPVDWFASRVRSLADVERDTRLLAARTALPGLAALEGRWRRVSKARLEERAAGEVPGRISWIRTPHAPPSQLLYMIWRDPWMVAAPSTFIGSVLQRLGFGPVHVPHREPYPQVDLNQFDPETTLLLFSSEPFPFGRYLDDLGSLPFASALVDGELFSWFGIRSLEFLERELGIREAAAGS